MDSGIREVHFQRPTTFGRTLDDVGHYLECTFANDEVTLYYHSDDPNIEQKIINCVTDHRDCKCKLTWNLNDCAETRTHYYDNGAVTKEATETADGEITYTCYVCSRTKTEIIPALGGSTEPAIPPDSTDKDKPADTSKPDAPIDPVKPLGSSDKNDKPTTPENPFIDVSRRAYYYDAVLWAADKGITTGTGDATFSPDQTCQRGQVVMFLWRAMGEPEPMTMNAFADVSGDTYYAKAVAWAAENGVTGGMGDGKFAPAESVTRGQFVTFLWRAAGKPAAKNDAAFTDVSQNAYYAEAVAWGYENGITTGTGDTTFSPDTVCTRAQIVTFLYRYFAE